MKGEKKGKKLNNNNNNNIMIIIVKEAEPVQFWQLCVDHDSFN